MKPLDHKRKSIEQAGDPRVNIAVASLKNDKNESVYSKDLEHLQLEEQDSSPNKTRFKNEPLASTYNTQFIKDKFQSDEISQSIVVLR